MTLHVEGAGLALLLLQGGPGLTTRSVAPISELLRDRFRVIRLENGDTTISGLIDRIEQVRRESGEERWFVLGHSWGAAMAALYAARHPERVAGLVLAHPMEIASEFLEPLSDEISDDGAPVVDYEQHVGEALWQDLHENWPDASGEGYDLAAVARRISTPTLVLTGERDSIDHRSGALWAELTNAQLVTLPEAAHWSFLERPVHFRQAVLAFLEAQPVERAMAAA